MQDHLLHPLGIETNFRIRCSHRMERLMLLALTVDLEEYENTSDEEQSAAVIGGTCIMLLPVHPGWRQSRRERLIT